MPLTVEQQQKALDKLWAEARRKQAAGRWTQADQDKLKADIERIRGGTIPEAIGVAAKETIGRELRPSPYGAEPYAGPAVPPAPAPPMPPQEPPMEPWPEMPPVEGLPPFEIPEEWMPQMGAGEQMTPEMLLAFVENMMRETTEPREDEEGNITYQRIYSEADIQTALFNILQDIQRREARGEQGFGPWTPYYGAAQQYYAQIAQTEAGMAGGGQLSPTDYLDYQLAQQQLALQQQLAMLPYQGLTAAEQARIEQQIADRQAQLDLAQQQLKLREQEMWLPYEEVPAGQEAQLALQREQMMLPYQQMTVAQQAAVGLEQQRYGAELAAQPHSWLEYAAYTGETPVTQPWQMPLMPQQYQGLQTGQPIPGWTPESGRGMPQLTTPSRQYQARIGPTAQQQFLGYEQARTGAPPTETEFRLWSQAPPGGQYGGLRYTR